MKKKALAYAATAIFLGIVMMLAPWIIIKQGVYIPMDSGDDVSVFYFGDSGGRAASGHGSLERMLSPPNLASAGWMIMPSFLIALGAFLYLKKRMS